MDLAAHMVGHSPAADQYVRNSNLGLLLPNCDHVAMGALDQKHADVNNSIAWRAAASGYRTDVTRTKRQPFLSGARQHFEFPSAKSH